MARRGRRRLATRQPNSRRLGTHSVPKPRQSTWIPGTAAEPRSSENPGACRQFFVRSRPKELLAMQKVEGSNPFSRLRKGLHLQACFVYAVGSCVCVSGYPLGTRGAARGASPSETRLFAGSLLTTRTSDLLRRRSPSPVR